MEVPRHFLRAAAVSLSLFVALPLPAPAAPNEGGSTQAKAQAGCKNQWLFNGMWRVRVTKVAFRPAADGYPNGWDVTMQWANGTSFPDLQPSMTNKQGLVLALANGDTLPATATTNGSLIEQKLDYHSFPASGQFTYTQSFLSSDPLDENNPPAKLLVTFDVAAYKAYHSGGGKYWSQKTAGYNYRIDLTCDKG
jgi:hypothetical protein